MTPNTDEELAQAKRVFDHLKRRQEFQPEIDGLVEIIDGFKAASKGLLLRCEDYLHMNSNPFVLDLATELHRMIELDFPLPKTKE